MSILEANDSPSIASVTLQEASILSALSDPNDTRAVTRTKMKVLVFLANFGSKNDHYLRQLLDAYGSMDHDVHVVVLTNVAKNLGAKVEVIVDTPKGDPWSFPFVHKQLFAERLEDYDLFIYSEDDTLITQRNIDAFLEVSESLLSNEIAGFIRSEKAADGSLHFSTVHAHFHWDARSVVKRGAETFAFFSNEHSACYILTREQLRSAIRFGGFLVSPHQERYDLLVSAATDPYTQCGFRKLICISRIHDFVLPHLPNKYIGKLGLNSDDFYSQVDALLEIGDQVRTCRVLLDSETRAWQRIWSKSYYEAVNPRIVASIPTNSKTVLTYGCGSGDLERALEDHGLKVTGLALDSVIGICAERKGVNVVYGSAERAFEQLGTCKFDCIILSNVLHLAETPCDLLRNISHLLSVDGTVIAVLPNTRRIPDRWKQWRNTGRLRQSFRNNGVHSVSPAKIRAWFSCANLRASISAVRPAHEQWLRSFFTRWFAEEFLVVAQARK